MFKSRKGVFFILPLLILLQSACSREIKYSEKEDEIPEIVYMEIWDYSDVVSEEEPQSAVVFIDKKGNRYFTDNSYIDGMGAYGIYDEFVEGKLDDVLSLRGKCDESELSEKVAIIKKLSEKEDYQIVDESLCELEIEEIKAWCMGFYFDKNNELSVMILQTQDNNGIHYANYEDATELCKWIRNSFQKTDIK